MKIIIVIFALIVGVFSFNSITKYEKVHKNGCIGVKTYWLRGTTTSLLCCKEPFTEKDQIVGFSTDPKIDSERLFVLSFDRFTANKTKKSCRYDAEKTGQGSW